MSNIYIQEPPTFGKVLLVTSVGDIDIELWAKETPKACRNFVQLCMEGYYNGTTFHRIVKGFIAQGGDPTGTGTGGESIYGHPFKDEFHTRLRFVRRGLVAMANSGKDDNGSQFFFTFAAAPELQNKHTIFGKVTGETIYNMIKLEEAVTDSNETALYPQKIIKAEILNNPFPDIIPRCLPEKKEKKRRAEKKTAGVKNFKLLSFGEEAEEDEVENKEISMSFAGKGKSTHDVLDDPKLSSVPAVESQERCESSLSGDEKDNKSSDEEKVAKLDTIRKKLKRSRSSSKDRKKPAVQESQKDDDYYFGKDRLEKKKQKVEEIQKEIKELKKEYQKDRKEKVKAEEKIDEEDTITKAADEDNELIEDYKNNLAKYSSLKSNVPKKGSSRESFTLSLLANFQKKLEAAKDKVDEGEKASDDDNDEGWLAHKLTFEAKAPVLAKDASTKSDDWFDITDPRNPINKRRRETSKQNVKRSF